MKEEQGMILWIMYYRRVLLHWLKNIPWDEQINMYIGQDSETLAVTLKNAFDFK